MVKKYAAPDNFPDALWNGIHVDPFSKSCRLLYTVTHWSAFFSLIALLFEFTILKNNLNQELEVDWPLAVLQRLMVLEPWAQQNLLAVLMAASQAAKQEAQQAKVKGPLKRHHQHLLLEQTPPIFSADVDP